MRRHLILVFSLSGANSMQDIDIAILKSIMKGMFFLLFTRLNTHCFTAGIKLNKIHYLFFQKRLF